MSAAQQEFDELMRDKERRTQHPEDDGADARSFLNLSDDEDADPDDASTAPAASDYGPSRPSMSSTRSATIPRARYQANTGPKGVIADAQNFRDSRRTHRHAVRTPNGGVADPTPATTLPLDEEEEDDEDLEGELLDGDFMAKWRKGRLRQLQNGDRHAPVSNGRARPRRLYGHLTTVDGEGYLNAVDKSPPDTVVIVYIYDDYSHVSLAIEECVRELAGKCQDTLFVKLHFEEAEMEPAGVPALIAYRNGDKFAGLVPLLNEIPEDADVSATTLEAVLKRCVTWERAIGVEATLTKRVYHARHQILR